MTKSRKIIVSVITDLVSDQRVHKICTYLHNKGFEVVLIGRQFKNSQPVGIREYKTERITCIFRKGVLQYAEFNLKLFVRILFKKADALLSNDLDTLLPNFLHAFLRNKKLIYDSHEYFTGTPELKHKPLKRKAWKWLEKQLLPKADFRYTVNQSIADLYQKEYGVEMQVVRNMPEFKDKIDSADRALFPKNKFVLLLQGAGINKDRGGEELVEAMQFLPPIFLLVLIGSGDAWQDLKRKTSILNLGEKVWFIDKVPFTQLLHYTRQAHLGLSLDKPNCINHQLSLPNKIFDYIHAGIPILTSDVIEVRKLVEKYKVGLCINEITPNAIAKAILWIYNHQHIYQEWKENTFLTATNLSWESEIHVLDEIYTKVLEY